MSSHTRIPTRVGGVLATCLAIALILPATASWAASWGASSASGRAARPAFQVSQDVSVYGWPNYDEQVREVGAIFSPAPDSVTYQWLRDGVPIVGATEDHYVIVPADPNHLLSVRATAHKAGYADTTSTSRPELMGYEDSPYTYVQLTGHVSHQGVVEAGIPVTMWLVNDQRSGEWTDVRPFESTTTDSKGAYTMYGVPSGTTMVVSATRAGLTRTTSGATSVYDDPGFTTASQPTPPAIVFDDTEPVHVDNPVTTPVSIGGTPEIGRVVHLVAPVFAHGTRLLAPHWRIDDHTLAGDEGDTLLLPVADLGSTVQLCVTALDSDSDAGYTCSTPVLITKASDTVVIKAPAKVATGVRPVVTVRVTSLVPRGGLLDIMDGARQVATARLPLANDGTVHLRLPLLAKGVHHLRIDYSGDNSNRASVSPPVRVVVD